MAYSPALRVDLSYSPQVPSKVIFKPVTRDIMYDPENEDLKTDLDHPDLHVEFKQMDVKKWVSNSSNKTIKRIGGVADNSVTIEDLMKQEVRLFHKTGPNLCYIPLDEYYFMVNDVVQMVVCLE